MPLTKERQDEILAEAQRDLVAWITEIANVARLGRGREFKVPNPDMYREVAAALASKRAAYEDEGIPDPHRKE